MSATLRRAVSKRANARCEYCQLPDLVPHLIRFQLEHIRARRHGGSSSLNSLAWACPRCNERKGTNLSAVDPDTNRVVRLFNPLNRSEHSILTARIFNPLPFLAPPIRQVRQIRRGFHPQPLRNPSQCHRGLPPQPRGNPHLLPVALAPPLQLFPLPTQRLQILPRQALGLGLRRLPNLLSGLSGLSGWLV